MTTENISPNTEASAVTDTNAATSLESIASKMAAMREHTLRNQLRQSEETAPGIEDEALESSSPVAPEEPEIAEPETELVDGTEAIEAQDEEPVSDEPASDTTAEEIIDFLEFAETNPNAKFKFMRNGKEVVMDAKKAASILGQGGAIHEEARQLKIEKSEFDEYKKEQKNYQDGLTLAMEFTVAPKLQKAYSEIAKTQQYNQVFQQQLANTSDPAEQAKILANIRQNEQYMTQQGQLIQQIKPRIDQFRDMRSKQVAEIIDNSRKAFKDKELKNEYVFNELREKVSKNWTEANNETVPGIKNIDLISADEYILGLIRDGLKFRDKPVSKQAGNSIAALTSRKGSSVGQSRGSEDNISKLREQAKGGDKKAADNLLVAQLQKIRASRGSR